MNEWRPISRAQEQFLALPDSIREAAFGGSAGPGKSECLMMYPIVREFIKHPRFKALFTRRTYGELKAEIIPRSRELYTAFGGKFNKADLLWEFPSVSGLNHSKSPQGAGALVFFGHIEHEDDVHKYDSMEINLFLPDEIQSLLEFMYLYIGFERVRTSTKELPAIIRGACMPGDIGHTWVKRRFIDPAPKGGKKIIGKGGNKRIFIFSTLADIVEKIPSMKDYAISLEMMPEAEKRAKKYGDWNSYEGQVFEEFRDRHYPGEPDNALHVIKPFDIPEWWPRVLVIDWGFTALTWCGYGAISPTKRLYTYREQSWRKVKISEWTPYVRENLDREDVKIIKVCKSAGQDRGQDHTIQQQIEMELGRSVELTTNAPGSRIAGKMLLHEYLRWTPKYVPINERAVYNQEVALWTLRNHGEQAYKNYMSQFIEPEPETNIPKWQIFDTCPILINALKSCVYDKHNVEDIAQFDGDDPIDGSRYLVDIADKFFSDAEYEFEKVEKRQILVQEFQETQDWNRLFRRALAIENNQDNMIKSIPRYKHRMR